MKPAPMLYCCRMTDESESFEIVPEFLSALEMQFSTWEDREAHRTIQTVYAETEAEGRDNFARLVSAVPEWRKLGVEIGDPEYFELKREDWSEVWKQFFPVLHLSEHLVVKPEWRTYEPKAGDCVIAIDPGMSFGTGQHATTAFCLRMLEKYASRGGSFLDAGCGSGILAIGAAKLGYAPVRAFDFDPDAVESANGNFALNGLDLTAEVGDAANFVSPECDFVAANILGHLLKAYRRNIASWVKPGGLLALAGILTAEFPPIAEAYAALGFELIGSADEKEWTGGLFRKKTVGIPQENLQKSEKNV